MSEDPEDNLCKVCRCEITDTKLFLKFSDKPFASKEVNAHSASIQTRGDQSKQLCSKCCKENEIIVETECDEIYIDEAKRVNPSSSVNVRNDVNVRDDSSKVEEQTDVWPISFKEVDCDSFSYDVESECDELPDKDPLQIETNETNNVKLASFVSEQNEFLEELYYEEAPSEQFFKCHICDKQFRTKYYLKTHMRFHSGERPFKCDVCGKDFTLAGNLTTHKRMHTGEKPYKCDVCLKDFFTSTHLSTHKRIHTGVKLFACNFCEKRFSTKEALKIHEVTHTRDYPFKCDFCTKGFIRRSRLTHHIDKCSEKYKREEARK